MNMVFGEKIAGFEYQIRKGVYAIIFNLTKDKVLTVQNSKGHYFLPGGGIENDETPQECLIRELLEETGYTIFIGAFIGNAMRYFQSTQNEPILNDGYFYLVELSDKSQEPIEDDHYVKWIDINSIEERLVHEHHCWAVHEALNKQN